MAENKDDEMYSTSYEDAKNKYGIGVGNNKHFMPKSTWEKRKEEYNKKKNAEKPAIENKPNEEAEPKKQQSLVANQFGAKKEKTWNDVKSEYNNDPAKIAEYLNSATDYTPGSLTNKGMEEFGYSKGEDGKWAPKPKEGNTSTTTTETKTTETKTTGATTDDAITGVEDAANGDPKVEGFVDSVTNKDGSVNEQKAYNAMSQYEQKLVEMGAGSFDKDGKFVFKDTTKKGWEDWATMLSVGASVIGIAMGVPIIPINFRKITDKDEKDAKLREFQKQYTDIMAGNAAKVEDVNSSAEAGKLAKENEEDINAYSKYKGDFGDYEAKSNVDTDSEKEIIDKNLEAEMALVNEDFKNKIGEMKLSHEQQKDLQDLLSKLSTDSAKELLNQERYGYLLDMAKDMKAAGMDDKAIALKIQSLAGNTATTQNLKHAQNVVGMIKDLAEAGSSFMPWGGKKDK